MRTLWTDEKRAEAARLAKEPEAIARSSEAGKRASAYWNEERREKARAAATTPEALARSSAAGRRGFAIAATRSRKTKSERADVLLRRAWRDASPAERRKFLAEILAPTIDWRAGASGRREG